jgi:hypothetical protein
MTFLALPPELRHTIYDLALPHRQLNTTFLRELGTPATLQTSPPLFLASHKIYSEAAPIFYSKATLCIPVPPSPNLQPFPTKALLLLPQHLKSALRTAHLFDTGRERLERDAHSSAFPYYALLGWLALNTGITNISINKGLMFHACKRHISRDGEVSDFLEAMSERGTQTKPVRIVRIFSRNDREFWEGRGMGAGRGTIVAEQAPSLRMFVCLQEIETTGLICDPRGTRKGTEENARAVGEVMDALRSKCPGLSDEEVAKTEGDGRWLFQVVFVV